MACRGCPRPPPRPQPAFGIHQVPKHQQCASHTPAGVRPAWITRIIPMLGRPTGGFRFGSAFGGGMNTEARGGRTAPTTPSKRGSVCTVHGCCGSDRRSTKIKQLVGNCVLQPKIATHAQGMSRKSGECCNNITMSQKFAGSATIPMRCGGSAHHCRTGAQCARSTPALRRWHGAEQGTLRLIVRPTTR